MIFETYQPDAKLDKYIKKYWIVRNEEGSYFEEIAPSGRMRIVFYKTTKVLLNTNVNSKLLKELHGKDEKFKTFHTQGNPIGNCAIIGPTLDYIIATSEGILDCIGVEFTYLGIRRFFSTPARVFKSRIASPQEIGDKDLVKLSDQLAKQVTDIAEKLNSFFIRRLSKIEYHNEMEDYTIEALNQYDYKANKVEDLKNFTYLQPRQTQRYFAEYIGLSPKEFILIQKLRKAVQMMRDFPDLSINEIVYDCGFCDTPYFNSVFNRFCGHTPSSARREIQTMSRQGFLSGESNGILSFCIYI